jgi:hypothetical protein
MATVPFDYDCAMENGFIMDPNEHKRFGYVTSLNGFGLPEALEKDLKVHLPFNTGATPNYGALTLVGASGTAPLDSAQVVGVLERFSWAGGVGDPIKLEFYVSQENAMHIMTLQQRALKTTDVKSLDWWIADYDQELKQWFEQAHPISTDEGITGHINGKDDPELEVNLTPVQVKYGVDVNVYKVTLGVVPAGKLKYKLHFASSHQKKVVRSWGVLIGTT